METEIKMKLAEVFKRYAYSDCDVEDFFSEGFSLVNKMESMMFIEMITEIEDEFGIEFEMDDLREEIISYPTKLLVLIENKKS